MPVVKPLVQESLHSQADRLQKDDQQYTGGERKEVAQRGNTSDVAEKQVVRERENEPPGYHYQGGGDRVAGDRFEIPQAILFEGSYKRERHRSDRKDQIFFSFCSVFFFSLMRFSFILSLCLFLLCLNLDLAIK